MNGDTVRRTASDAFDEFGIYTVSVFLALDVTVDELCRDRPELQRYGKVRLTTAGRLRSLGFALVPTLDRPHYDVVLPDLADATLDRLELGFDRPIPEPSSVAVRTDVEPLWAGYRFPMALWDLWLDYHRRDADGLTHGNVRNVAPGATLRRRARRRRQRGSRLGRRRGRARRRRRCRPLARRCRERSRTIERSCTPLSSRS